MSCKNDLDYLGIPIVDLSKWESGVEDDRIDIIEDRLDNIENNIQKILDKLQNNGNYSSHDLNGRGLRSPITVEDGWK